jgi:hypothetical protein
MIGSRKGRGGEGFALGLLLGPIGILIAWAMKGNRRTCPACQSLIHQGATVCPFCREHIKAVAVGGLPPPNKTLDQIGLFAAITMAW